MPGVWGLETTDALALIAALTALASAVIGPLVSVYLLKREFRSSLREKRTHELRAAAERIITVAQRAHNMRQLVEAAKKAGQKQRALEKLARYDELVDKELSEAAVGIYMLLDPENPLHINLRDLVPQFGTENLSGEQFNALRNRAIKAARNIIRDEYEKAKAGE